MSKDDANIGMLKNYMDIGIGLLMTASFTAVKTPEIFEAIQNNTFDGILSLLLFVLTCLWLSAWIYFDFQEIQIIDEAFDTSKINVNSFPFVTAVMVGIGAGILINFTGNPKVYTIITGAILFVSLFGIPVVRKNIDKAEAIPGHEIVAGLIRKYYEEHRFILVDVVTLAFMVAGVVLVWNPSPEKLIPFSRISSILVFVVLLAHELIYWNWRIRRNREIDKARSEVPVKVEVKKLSSKKKS